MPTLSETKLHLRVDHADEDSYISSLIDAAGAAVLDYLDVPELPDAKPIMVAVLLLVGALYENREAVTDRPLADNPLYVRLLAPYRALGA